MSEPASAPGLFASLRRVVVSLAAIAGNRFELLIVELQEERNRLVTALTLLLLCLLFTGFALALLTGAAVYLLWGSHPLAALLGVAALYGVAAAGAGVRVRRLLHDSQPFASTLAEIHKDQQCFQPKPTTPSASESNSSSSRAS